MSNMSALSITILFYLYIICCYLPLSFYFLLLCCTFKLLNSLVSLEQFPIAKMHLGNSELYSVIKFISTEDFTRKLLPSRQFLRKVLIFLIKLTSNLPFPNHEGATHFCFISNNISFVHNIKIHGI